MRDRIRFLFVGLSVAAAVSACAMQNANVSEDVLMNQVQSGTAVLSCTSNCELTWQKQRPNALAMFNAEQWHNLAVLVMRVGYGNDLSYYYLGRAAQALGYRQAAQNYYRDSEAQSATAVACARGSSAAAGLNLGAQILSNVSNTTAQAIGNVAQSRPELATGNACDGFTFPDNAETSLQIVNAELNPAPAEERHVVHRRIVKKPTTTTTSSSAPSSQGIVEAPSSTGSAPAAATSSGAAPAASSSGIVEAK
jgi:hypothetical protein